MTYVDGFILPVPTKNMAAYRKMAMMARDVWLEHGALDYREAVGDDVQPGKSTSFPQSVKLKSGEAVIFSYVLYKNRKDRDRIMAKVMADPRLNNQMEKMPFDGERMFWGGFETIVETKARATGARASARKPAVRKSTARSAKTNSSRAAAKRTPAKRTSAKRPA